MGYFSEDDIDVLCGAHTGDKSAVTSRFETLHQTLYHQIQANDLDLSLIRSPKMAVTHETLSRHSHDDEAVLSVQYTRTRSKAVAVERLMGREELASVNNLIVRLHPVMEVRLAENGLTVELIVSPDAWWDQQNLKGKLSIARHKQEFYSLLMTLDAEYAMGFWQGTHLSEMNLSGKYFQHPRILDEWLSTFQPNADWFRLGVWYEVDHDDLSEAAIITTLSTHIQKLFPIYKYFLWTSDNNFRDFIG